MIYKVNYNLQAIFLVGKFFHITFDLSTIDLMSFFLKIINRRFFRGHLVLLTLRSTLSGFLIQMIRINGVLRTNDISTIIVTHNTSCSKFSSHDVIFFLYKSEWVVPSTLMMNYNIRPNEKKSFNSFTATWDRYLILW